MPSTLQRSGRLESCSSNRISPVAVSTSLISLFTSGSHASSSLSVTCRPRSLARSLRLAEMVGMASVSVLHPLGADHLQVGGEEVADVVDFQRDHRHAVETQTPCDHGDLYAQGEPDLRPEEAGAAQLDPAQAGMAHVHFNRRLCEGKVG